MRVALGASRWRVVQQLLAESVLVGGLGATASLLIASWASRLLVRQLSTDSSNVFVITSVFLDVSLDWRVLAFTLATTAATVLLCATGPALRLRRVAPTEAIAGQIRTSRAAHGAFSSGLMVAQVAFSIVLVIAAGLFVRTFTSLATRRLGFDRNRVLVVTIGRTACPTKPRRPNALVQPFARGGSGNGRRR